MRINNRILYMPDPAPGTGTATPPPTPWTSVLPDDLRANPMFSTIPDVATLAKGYVHAQTMIGQKRLAVPGKDAAPEAWNEVYTALGRPETPDKYTGATVKPVAGVTISDAEITKARTKFHELGLNDRQATALLDYYNTGINEGQTAMAQRMTAGKASAEESLRTEWGAKYDANVTLAKDVMNKFSTPEAMQEIEAGLGNSPALIKMFHSMGLKMMDDRSVPGGGVIDPSGPAGALQKITELKQNAEFQKTMNNKQAPGHKDAVAQWINLHRQAFPNSQAVE